MAAASDSTKAAARLSLLNLRNLLQVLPRDVPYVRILVPAGDGFEDLANAGVGIDRLEEADGLGTDAGIGVVEECLEDRVTHAGIHGDVGLESFEGFAADAGILVVTEGDHERVADGAAGALMAGLALAGEEVHGVIMDDGVGAIARAEEQKLPNLRVVKGAEGGFRGEALEADFNVFRARFEADAANAGNLRGVDVSDHGNGCCGVAGQSGLAGVDGAQGCVVAAPSSAGDTGENEHCSHDGCALQRSEAAPELLAHAPKKAALGERIKSFIETKPGAGEKTGGRFRDGEGRHGLLQGGNGFHLLAAALALSDVLFQAMDPVVG